MRPGEGLFPPWSLGFEALKRAFALQDYTTLPVLGAVIGLAIWSWRTASGAAGNGEGEGLATTAAGSTADGSKS